MSIRKTLKKMGIELSPISEYDFRPNHVRYFSRAHNLGISTSDTSLMLILRVDRSRAYGAIITNDQYVQILLKWP